MAFDAFLKIDGIEGESTDDKHKGEIEVLSFSWGASQPGQALGAAVGRQAPVRLQGITILKRIDVATPQLMQQSCGGGSFPTATLTVRRLSDSREDGGIEEFLKIRLADVIVAGFSAAGNTQTEPVPVEQVSFNFSKIEFSVMSPSGESYASVCGDAFNKAQ